MKMSRKDVEVSKQLVICDNASWLGFSTNKLKVGMFFVYTGEGGGPRLARMHYQIDYDPDPLSRAKGHIVAQVASDNMQYTMERWVDPDKVTETIPAERLHQGIRDFFEYAEGQQP